MDINDKLPTYDELLEENRLLRCQLQSHMHHQQVEDNNENLMSSQFLDEKNPDQTILSIVVMGASGDLAFKKTFPALFSLYCHGLLPATFQIVGYARSKLTDDDFKKKISSKFSNKYEDKIRPFLEKCSYVAGQYDDNQDYFRLNNYLHETETKIAEKVTANRIFYFAIPPNIFNIVAKCVQSCVMSKSGYNRIILEKPFGHDLASALELEKQIGTLFTEDQVYRIDHYLGKEMVQNLMVLRFANSVFEPLWNSHYIQSVQIVFKEDFGTQGRGGYFDNFGIIRDVMQNHLVQILSLIGMEFPVTLNAEDVRNEKVKFLRSIAPINMDDVVIGQYTRSKDGVNEGYLDDPTVPAHSITPTFATCVLHIKNERWSGTPFILKCGKGLNERKAEIRIQFRTPKNNLFSDISPNELVLRVQPDEAVYLKMSTKQPGLESALRHTELNLTYKTRFKQEYIPDAYERLILDVIRGDQNLFVRQDELIQSWRLFSPLLEQLDSNGIKPIQYSFGTRGPIESDTLIEKYGYIRTTGYTWE